MKNTIKLFGIVAIVAAVGLLVVSCLTVPTNTSIDGVWDRGDIVITISGDTAVFTQFNQNYRHIEVVNIGMVNIGDQNIRNIKRVGYYSFTGELLYILSDKDSSGEIIRYTGLDWRNCTISVSTSGKIMTIDGVDTYTKMQ
ncbi:MAG: hypothetical protein LBB89_03865 [Treponema sp.]|jgi:hypothetical protein|nr:hypothetical protein [Treponema sp.]